MKKIRFAIYGCGMIANIHATAINEIKNADLIGAGDIKEEFAARFAEKYGIKTFPDYESLIHSDEIDAICICTPSGTHANLAIEAINCGKNVVLEKPMAITVEECDRIVEACEKSTGKLMVISQLRTVPDVKRAKEIIASGALGKITICDVHMKYYRSPEYFKGSWKGTKKMDGGGALMNQGIHGIDLLQYICGPIKNIQSCVRTLVHDIEVEDTAVAIAEFESGAIGVIEATTSVYPGFNRVIEVCGSRGSLVLKEGRLEKVLLADGEIHETVIVNDSDDANDPTKVKTEGHRNQISGFVNMLLGKGNVEICDQYEGRKAVEIIERIYKSTN